MVPGTNATGASAPVFTITGVAVAGNTGAAATVRTATAQACCRASTDLPPSMCAGQQACVSWGTTQLVSHHAADQDTVRKKASSTHAATERIVISLILARPLLADPLMRRNFTAATTRVRMILFQQER
jgi:hypothetical protein